MQRFFHKTIQKKKKGNKKSLKVKCKEYLKFLRNIFRYFKRRRQKSPVSNSSDFPRIQIFVELNF